MKTNKPHAIELAQLQEWMAENECIYASSSFENKKLTMTMGGSFKLYHNGDVVWQGIQPFAAVKNYNEII